MDPLLWYQLRRLRLAIEIDCDARVVRRTPESRVAYGLLLIDDAERMARGTPLATTLGHPRSALEWRIHMLTGMARRPIVAAGWALGTLALLIAACAEPTTPPAGDGESMRTNDRSAAAADMPIDTGTVMRDVSITGPTGAVLRAKEATFSRTLPNGTPEVMSIQGTHLVRFEMRVNGAGEATSIRFASDTPEELKAAARRAIGSSQYRRNIDQTDADWVPAILALP